MSFQSLGLSDEIVRAVHERGYTEPTPIQSKAIPAVLSGGDLLAGAQTGTGKTAGFVLPILQRLTQNAPAVPAKVRIIRALILTPTRELAAQVEESVRDYGKHLKLRSTAVFGGVGMQPQIDRLRGKVDVLVATPGRLLDHVQQRTVDLSKVEILVLDEADRMLDMGFIHDVKRIINLLPKQRQSLLFSATFSDEIKSLADTMLNAPELIEVARRNAPAEKVEQKIYRVDRERKRELLAHLISEGNWHQVLVFTRTKHGANRLAEELTRQKIPSLAIHGNKSQSARTRALAQFKQGELQVLVATDIAARGIDISDLPHVVNFELPHVPEDYVHRIGRTGRAGAEGEASSLVCIDEDRLLMDIERVLKRKLPELILPGFEPDPKIPREPITKGGQRGAQGGRGRASPGGGRAGGHAGSGARTSQGARGGSLTGSRAAGSGSGFPSFVDARNGAPPRTGRPAGAGRPAAAAGRPANPNGPPRRSLSAAGGRTVLTGNGPDSNYSSRRSGGR